MEVEVKTGAHSPICSSHAKGICILLTDLVPNSGKQEFVHTKDDNTDNKILEGNTT